MSFRIEEKIPVTPWEAAMILSDISLRGATTLYPPRKIHSVYFDTYDGRIFHDSDEGSLPRKKIRIRCYPESQKIENNIEIKTSSIEGRFKTSKNLPPQEHGEIIHNGYFDNLYGLVFPIYEISYNREYFSFQGVRITLDNEIKYTDYCNKNISVQEPWNVIEIKAPYGSSSDFLTSLISTPRRRFSKFSNAASFLARK